MSRRCDLYRLNDQYSFLKKAVGHPQVVPPEIDIAYISRVIDVGAGTGPGTWGLDRLDLVSRPAVGDSDDIRLFACDISNAKFPREAPEEKKITFFEHNVTEPFPDELIGTFDPVNLSCLCYALTSKGWTVVAL